MKSSMKMTLDTIEVTWDRADIAISLQETGRCELLFRFHAEQSIKNLHVLIYSSKLLCSSYHPEPSMRRKRKRSV